MAIYLSIAAVVVLALLATSKRAYRFRRSRLGSAAISGGWIAVTIGALLGPSVSGLISEVTVSRATPLLSVGLGWIGLMVGLQARRDILMHLPKPVWRLSALDAVFSVVVVAAATLVLMFFFTEEAAPTTAFVAAALVAALLAPVLIGWSMETRSLGIERATEGRERAVLLRASGGLSAIIAVTVFGISTAFLPLDLAELPDRTNAQYPLRLGGVAAAAGIGIVLAIIAKEALRLAGKNREELLVVFLGVVALAAGISADLGISPLFPAMLTGATLANLRSEGPSDPAADTAIFGRFILQAEHVVAGIFALLAGILLIPQIPMEAVYVVCGLILARFIIKPLAFTIIDRGPVMDANNRSVARAATIRQSPVALALAVSLFVLAPEPEVRILLTVVVLVGFSCDLLAAMSARRRLPAPEVVS